MPDCQEKNGKYFRFFQRLNLNCQKCLYITYLQVISSIYKKGLTDEMITRFFPCEADFSEHTELSRYQENQSGFP